MNILVVCLLSAAIGLTIAQTPRRDEHVSNEY